MPSSGALDVPHLLHFQVSHYNEKVRWALDHKGIAHTREALLPGFHVPRVRRLTGQNQVPVLVLDGEPIAGSARILEALERRHPEPALFPEDPALRARALELQATFDDEVAPALRRLFWSTYLDHPALCVPMIAMGASDLGRAAVLALFPLLRPVFRHNMGVDEERLALAHARLGSYFDRIEAALGEHGYLVGDRFGVADLAVCSVMSAILRPPEFPYPLPEPLPHGLLELRARVADRPGARWVLDVFRRHRGASAEVSAER